MSIQCRSLIKSAAATLLRQRSQPLTRQVPAAAATAAYSVLSDPDMPVEMEDPYKKPIRKCVLCQKDVPLDYKNARLLSQFVSPYTGRVYGRHITGLCQPMQERVAELIEKARKFGYMASNIKETFFLSDPALFRNPLAGPGSVGGRATAAAAAAKKAKAEAAPTKSEDGEDE